jgi:hypothetical protein
MDHTRLVDAIRASDAATAGQEAAGYPFLCRPGRIGTAAGGASAEDTGSLGSPAGGNGSPADGDGLRAGDAGSPG